MKWNGLKSKIREYLTRGMCPRELALTITLAILLGVFPLYGVTTMLMIMVSQRFRLNTPLMLSTGYLFTPLLFVLWIPFIRLGHYLTHFWSTPTALPNFDSIFDQGGLDLIINFSSWVLMGILGWIVVSFVLIWALYFPALFLVKRLIPKLC